MSVLDDPTARLYAGALLGKALTKEVGEVGAQQDQLTESTRRATIVAGVASGRIKPSQLSKQDAGLFGDALLKGGQVKIPSILGDPLGFVGQFGKNLASGAGEFAESLKGVPQGLLSLGEAFGQEAKKTVVGDQPGEPNAPFMEKLGEIGKGVAHDFSSPRQIYEHPFNPLMDVASLASAGAGAAVKGAGALSRAGLVAGDTGIAGRLIRAGSTLGRTDAVASPGFTAENADKLAEAGVEASKIPRPYSPNLGMKYIVQKPLDAVINRLSEFHLPGAEETIGDLQGKYYGRKLINRTRAQISAGTNQEFMHGPVQDFLKSTQKLYKSGQAAGQYQFEATMLHSMGIDTLDKLDAYAEHIKAGEDIDGTIMSPDMQRAATYRADQLYQDPRFRQLIEKPTDAMKEVAYNMRRVNVDQATKLSIDPITSENSALGRIRALTGKTNEEVRADLPATLRPFNKFATGLQTLQETILGKGVAERVPTVKELAYEIPYGSVPQKLDILERAVSSLKEDLASHESLYDRLQNPKYIQGNNLFDKVATALHDELGIDSEQAQSFARGVALGSPEGPILPTYVPSVSSEKLKFGVRPDALKTRVGRMLGVSKFSPLEGIEKQPTFYDFKRPFNPRTASAQTIGLGPAMNYTKEASYGSFLAGVQRMDPEAIIKNAYQIQRDLITKRLNDSMIQRLAVKAPDGTVKLYHNEGEMFADLGTHAALYKFVPVDTWRNYFKSQTELQVDVAQTMESGVKDEQDLMAEIEGLADEAAHKFVSEEMAKAATGRTEGVALPLSYVKTIVAHARLSEQGNAIGRSLSFLQGRWKSAVLTIMPSWLLRTTLGHGIIALIDGTVNPKFWMMAHDYFSDRPILPEDTKAIMWGNKYGDTVLNPEKLPYGVNQGGMMHELEDIGQGGRGDKLDVSKTLLGRDITKGVHVSTNFQRRAIFLRSLDRAAKSRLAELGKDFDHPGGFWNAKNIDAVLDPEWRKTVLQYPNLIEHAMDQLSKVSYTFGEMSPWERQLVKYGMPFYGWYKFISKFVWGMPINYPGRTAAIAALGKLGVAEHEKLGALPEYLSGAVWFNHSDLSKAKYLNLYGLNPLQDIADPMGKEGVAESMIRLGQTSPVIQAVLAAYGINPVTGGTEEIDPRTGIETGKYGELLNTKTGEEVSNPGVVNAPQRLLGTFLRAFPEIRAAELLKTGGNPIYPESIPLLDEHPIGVNPTSRHGFNAPSMIEQELGVQPRTYNISKHTADLIKALVEAKKKNEKTIAKAEAKLKVPNP